MGKQVYFFDEKNFFDYTAFVYNDETLENLENFSLKAPPDGLIKPKFVDGLWIEGASYSELIKSNLTYENKNIGIEDMFLLFGAYLKGGEDMFFEVLLNFWIEGKIDTAYLDKAVSFKIISKEEADFIKLTPRVEA